MGKYVFATCMILLAQMVAAQEAWTVTLTAKQAKALAEIAVEDDVTAFAISPDGAWGRSWGVNNADNAAARAMNYCQGQLRPRKRDCILYEVDGRRVAPEVVQTRQVSMVYKPVNGRQAAELFGRVAFDFRGDSVAAQAQFATGPSLRGDLPEDTALRAMLMNRSLMSIKTKGYALTFEDRIVEYTAEGQSGMLKAVYNSWTVTPAGLICMFDGYWSTGKPLGTRCLILNSAVRGAVDTSWAFRPGASQKMQLIAGDARFATAK